MSSYESKLRFVTKLQFAKVNRSSFYMDRYVLWVPNMLGLLLKYLETAGRLLLEKFLALLFYSFVCFAGSAFVARADIVALNFPVGYVGQFVGGSSAAKDPSNNKTLQELGFSYFAIQQDSDATMDVNGVIYPAFTSISTTAPLQGNDTRLAVYGVYSNGTRTSLFYPVLNFTFNQKKTFGLFLKPAKADPTGYYSTFSTFNPSNEDVDEGISYALVDAIYTVGHGSTFDINIDGNLTNSANNPNEDDLNAYLRSLYEDNLIPAGPVEVSAQKICATDASFDLTGIATIANGESLTVSFEGSNYYYGVTDQNDTITVSGDGWTIPGLEVPSEGDFDVAAKISNATGYLIVDGSSLEISVSNTHCFVPNPALTVVKTSTGTDLTVAGGETVWNPTDTISYKVAVTNSGNVSLGTVELSDPLASGSSIPFTTDSNVTEATLVIDDNILQPGETWEYTYDYAVTQDNINAGKVLNTAVVTSKDNDDVTVTGKSDADLDAGVDADNTGDTDDDPLVVTLDKTAALTVVKTSTGTDLTVAGGETVWNPTDTISYKVAVTNSGNVSLGTVELSDPLASGSSIPFTTDSNVTEATLVIDDNILQPGETWEYTYDYAVTQDNINAGKVLNTAVVTSKDNDDVTVTGKSDADLDAGVDADNTGDTDDDPLVVTLDKTAALTVVKTSTGTDLTVAGGETVWNPTDTISYKVAVTNSGNVSLGTVELSDPLASGSSIPFTTDSNVTEATLVIDDNILQPGETWEYTYDYAVTQDNINAGKVLNTAVVTSKDNDDVTVTGKSDADLDAGVDADNTGDTDDDPLVVTLDKTAALTVVKTSTGTDLTVAGGETVWNPTDTISYKVAVTNSGNVSLGTVELSDPLASGSSIPFTTDSNVTEATLVIDDNILQPGETWEYTYDYAVTQDNINAGKVLNTAVVTSKDNDDVTVTGKSDADLDAGVDADNTGDTDDDPLVVTLDKTAALTVVKTSTGTDLTVAGGETVWNPTDTISYKVAVTNSGNVSLGTVELSDPLASGSSIPFTTDSNVTEATLVIDDNILQPGETWEYTYDYAVTQDNINAGKVLNTAVVTSKDNDDVTVTGKSDADLDAGVDADNTGDTDDDPLVVTLDKTAALTVVKTSTGTDLTVAGGETVWNPTDTISYKVAVTNSGNVSLGTVELSDPLASGSSIPFTTDSNVTEATLVIDDNILQPGETWEYTYDYAVTQDNINAGKVLNTAVVTSKDNDDVTVTGKSDADLDAGVDADNTGDTDDDPLVVTLDKTAALTVANDDESFGNILGESVAIVVLDNDDYEVTSPIVKLLEDSVEKTELVVVGEGKWTVSENENTVTFTPESDFFGDPTVVSYLITDSKGSKSNAATITIDYKGVANSDDLVAADDQLIGQPKGVPVSLYPLLNDANGSPDTLDTSTLRLLDKDNNIVDSNEVVVAGEGKWNVYPETGRVTFTPEPGFSGSSVSITYVVESLDGIKQTAVMKILFIDPRGVVYDDSTLQPISGVTLQFKRADGTVPEASCFENGQQPQTTGSDGRYQFDIAVNCINPVTGSSEEFQIEITDTPGYLTDPSTNGKETNPLPYDPETNLSDTLEVVTYDRAPFVGETRKFYTSFFIGTNSKQIVNNHIPLVRLSKLIEDDLRNVLRDDLIATMTQQSRQMAGYAEGALQRLKDNTDNSCSAAIADQLEHNPVMFETALARIIPESAATLDAVANLLAQCSDTAFDVEGHTDSRGDDADNAVLSNARATAVVKALRQRGTPVEQLSAVGYGETRPIADNATPEGQALNRRVVFTVFDQDLSNASCNENNILERSMDVKADQNGATVDGKYLKESRNCTANSWTTWEGAATFLKTDTGMSQGMLNITRRQEWLLDNDRLRGYFFGAYASNNDITGLATGSIKGFGLTAGGYGAQRISGGSYIDYYLGASTGRHNFDLDFDRVDGAINADGHYDYLATFAGLSFSGETKVGDYKIVPRAGFEAAWSPGGQADYVASREAISDASSLDTGGVSGGRLYGEVRFDDLAPNEPYQLAFKPKLFCDQPLGGGDGICGMGASIELSSTAIDGKGLFTFEIEAEQTRDSRFWGLSFDYSLPVWAGELNIINTLSNQGKLAFGLNYERAF